MIDFILHLLRKRKGFIAKSPIQTIAERLNIGGRVADYLVEVREETQDTVKFSGNVADWVVKYIPPDYLTVKGSVSEYGVKITISETVKIDGLTWTYSISRIFTERLNIRCYIKPYREQ